MSLNLEERYSAFVIGEAGTCHASGTPDYRFSRAMQYVHAAAGARVDAVKFQIFHNPSPETMFCWMDGDEIRSKRWLQSALNFSQWKKIKHEAESCGITFLASAFEYQTVKWLSDLDCVATKVASRAAPYLDEFDEAPRPLLVSNGMCSFDPKPYIVEIECEAEYPSTMRWQETAPGFSDHSGNPLRAIDAISRGCKLIEVHYYLKPIHAGPDHPASLSIEDLELVCKARNNFAALK